MRSILSKVELYIINQQIYNSSGFYSHKFYIWNKFEGAITENKEVLQCEGFDNERDPEDITKPLPDPFFCKESETAK